MIFIAQFSKFLIPLWRIRLLIVGDFFVLFLAATLGLNLQRIRHWRGKLWRCISNMDDYGSNYGDATCYMKQY